VIDTLSSFLLIWVTTFFLHSGVLIGVAFLAERLGLLKNIRFAELVWRMALFGGLITASLQILLAHSTDATPNPLATSAQVTYAAENNEGRLALASAQTTDIEQQAHTSSALTNSSLVLPNLSALRSTQVIALPSQIGEYSLYFVLIWFAIALGYCFHTVYTASRINRLVKTFPLTYKTEIAHILKKFKTINPSQIKLRISDQWSSPLVTPNNTICLPTWTYSELSHHQFEAMLSHELSHVSRADPAWRIATQLVTRICFFQPLLSIPVNKLAILAELACDQNAAKSSGRPHDLAQALYICAKALQANEAPSLALAMSRRTSPLMTRIESLLDEPTVTRFNKQPSGFMTFSKLSSLTVVLIATAYAMPLVSMQIEQKLETQVGKMLAMASEIPVIAKTVALNFAADTKAKSGTKISTSVPSVKVALPNNGFASLSGQRTTLETQKAFELTPVPERKTAEPGFATQPALQKLEVVAEQKSFRVLESNLTPEAKAVIVEGNAKTQKYLPVSAEREKRKVEIANVLREFDVRDLKAMETKCQKPSFDDLEFTPRVIEKMVEDIDFYATCFNRYSESLRIAFEDEKVISPSLLPLLSDEEVQKITSRNKNTYAMLRVKAKITAEEFNQEKRSWESRTRDFFGGKRNLDWSSIKRVSFVEKSVPDAVLSNDQGIAVVERAARFEFR
jgi:beta-lactamase regulating signal transducer with metallopeptidase domain